MTRTPRLLVLAAVAVVALSGCGDVVQSGAAATVGDERISTSALEDLVARSLKDPGAQQSVGADRIAFERAALRRLISHAIVEAAAEREDVTIDGGDIDAVLDRFAQQAGGEDALRAEAVKQGIAPEDLRDALADVALRDAISDKLTEDVDVPEQVLRQAYDEHIGEYDQVRSAHILVAGEAQARQILAAVQKDPARFPAFAAKFSTDTSNKDNGGDLGFQGRGALEKPFEDAIFGTRPGSFVIAKTRFGYHVIAVIERRTTTFEDALVDLRRNLLGEQRQAALEDLLLRTGRELEIEVNPRFGTWNEETQEVLPLKDDDGVTRKSPGPDDVPSPAPS